MHNALQTLNICLRTHLWLRWMLANVIGWSAGLYLGSLSLQIIGGLLGVLLGGGVAGATAGAAQWFALRGQTEWADRRWIWWSASGGMFGALPLLILSFVLVIGGIGWAILGVVFGAIFGLMQWGFLRQHIDRSALWILANGIGGGVCALLSLSGGSLPIFCTPGPYLFGGITAYLLLRLLREEAAEIPTPQP